ncbi:hypothetical protein CEP51_013180 [Fusarium floridanum]|uniref:Uncharacterized protein n=1 Tax=Fusarium floridanum TaxID=1325733 RepID=A0A428QG20_9HYPO|nr:hypothetical protein CEP51_013180 [Fusarium floridanum]
MEGEDEALASCVRSTAVGSAPVNVLLCVGSGDDNSDEDDSENESEQKSIPGLEHTTEANLVFTPLLQDLPFLDQGLLICMAAYDDSIDRDARLTLECTIEKRAAEQDIDIKHFSN